MITTGHELAPVRRDTDCERVSAAIWCMPEITVEPDDLSLTYLTRWFEVQPIKEIKFKFGGRLVGSSSGHSVQGHTSDQEVVGAITSAKPLTPCYIIRSP